MSVRTVSGRRAALGASPGRGMQGMRGRVAVVAMAAAALSPLLVACGDDRPPKPRCQTGYQADWDDDDHEWECERRSSGSSDHGRSRRSRR